MFTIVFVSVPYEITLLSNAKGINVLIGAVSVPYEITLLSNYLFIDCVPLLFQYLMKLHYSQTPSSGNVDTSCFSTL